MTKSVIVFKTHIWNDDLEKFVVKIFNQARSCSVDFYVVMHTENNDIYHKITTNYIKDITLVITEADIRQLYQKGFYSMWLSNHWILMWFYKKFATKYEYFWNMEYDVRISGDSRKLWSCTNNDDFMYVTGFFHKPNHLYFDYYIGNKIENADKYFGFLQLARYSNKLLAYLNECFESGENGQDELIIFSLIASTLEGADSSCKRGLSEQRNCGNNFAGSANKFSCSNKLLSSMQCGAWTWDDAWSNHNKCLYEMAEKMNYGQIYIYHPVK